MSSPLKLGASLSGYRGCLLGGAVGDALGAPIEFDSRSSMRKRFGPQGLRDFEPAYGRRGAITDSTQMTLFTAEGIIRAKHRAADKGFVNVAGVLQRAYWRWLSTQGIAAPKSVSDNYPGWLLDQKFLHARRAPGLICVEALALDRPAPSRRKVNDSKGCGGAVRVAPIGLARGIDPFKTACEAAAITHGDPSGFLPAGAFAQIIAELCHGRLLEKAVERSIERLKRHPGRKETLGALSKALRLAQEGQPIPGVIESFGDGSSAPEALAMAVFCGLAAKSFEHGVLMAVNHGGKSTASIAGNILGLRFGVAVIPKRWLKELEGRQVIAQVATDLWRTFVDGSRPKSGRALLSKKYPPN